jgi:hypothetical protein
MMEEGGHAMRFLLPALILVALTAPTWADNGIDFFEQKIRPVLAKHCYECHSAHSRKLKGKLALDSKEGVRKGGESGPAVVPGMPGKSLLLRAISYTDDEMKMPPRGKLPDAVIADLRHWVEMGAPDPRNQAAALVAGTVSWEQALKSRRQWWSLQPVRRLPLPDVKDSAWPLNPVDRFVLARLEKVGLKPAESADRRALIRRLSLVLTGLPPRPDEVEEFVRDDSVTAYEKLVDRLLASPHFGERWARHWMDLVRYAETHGFEWNYEVHHAWRYRDHLIRALNEDVPYDQLVREHIAGDLLARPRLSREGAINESVIGTAFWRFGEVGHDDCIEFREIGLDAANNQIDTLSKAFQATTIACARCHDHKLDAVSMKDYYALLGIVQSARQVSNTIDIGDPNAERKGWLVGLKHSIRKELAFFWGIEAQNLGKYLLAAQAVRDKESGASDLARDLDPLRLSKWVQLLANNSQAPEEPLWAWQALRGARDFAAAWQRLAARYRKECQERAEFNARNFTSFGNLGGKPLASWQHDGPGLTAEASGDFTVALEGDAFLGAVFPNGLYTHGLSERLNGALRSPILPRGKKHLSLRVLGGRAGAVRVVSNNCQLNYKNFKYLASDRLSWITLPLGNQAGLRQYAELMTKYYNPKYPDQLGALGGGDTTRIPWDQAAADPRSFFGVTRAVLHDCDGPPRDELTHLQPLFAGPAPRSLAELANRYSQTVAAAVQAWAEGRASDEDACWLDWLRRHGLLGNSQKQTPRLARLVAEYREIEKGLVPPEVVPGLADMDDGFDQPLFLRGDYKKPGATVPHRYLEVLATTSPHTAHPPRRFGRLELAESITNPANPLTARVMVNRVWHHLFGTGIVRTVDDFGHVGELPSHPELLDWLAYRFVQDGWSIKRLIRQVVLSRTFRESSRATVAGKQIDPQDRLLHHYPARRMEAEAIRDSILAASGRLDHSLYGPSIQAYREKENADRRLFPGPLDGRGRRSIYIKPTLMEAPSFLKVFNFPAGKVCQGRRDVTNVPAQALALLNDPFVLQQADYWAARLVTRPHASVAARVEHMFLVALGRPPWAEERDSFEKAVTQLAALRRVVPEAVLRNQALWKDMAQALFNAQEFIYIR